MRYTRIELQYSDIMWFGVDINGYVAAFTSGGEAFVPEFVCKSKEETEFLEEFFLEQLDLSTEYILAVEEKDNYLIRDSKKLSRKGLFCFDVSSAMNADYERISRPKEPVNIADLPTAVTNLLKSHRIGNSFDGSTKVSIDRSL